VSPRTRVRLLAAAAGLAAAGIAVGATLMGGDDEATPTAPVDRGPPALELGAGFREDAQARELQAAERQYDGGNATEARRRFDDLVARYPESLEARVGAAVASWPDGTVTRLRELAREHPDSALVRLHLGLALYASGQDSAAESEWRGAKRHDPDTPSALRAEDLLHPDMAPGRPFFYADRPPPREVRGLSPLRQVEELHARAREGGAREWIQYGIALQRVGRTASAQLAFEQALDEAPESLAAQVAAGVGAFDKDNVAAAFSQLGPLTRSHPRSALLRFHLGLLLLWIRDVEDAETQLQRAVDAEPRGFYGREAHRLLSRLEDVRT
jgi:predicted Zn-dependent protease